MIPIYKQTFNLILDCGIIPESWSVVIIKPIYKNKGDPIKPENYRPITILSCFGKLFTLILNNRLKVYTENHNVMNSCQAGFRHKHSTVDNLFIIKKVSSLLHVQIKQNYIAVSLTLNKHSALCGGLVCSKSFCGIT